jgi:hypothetical protein
VPVARPSGFRRASVYAPRPSFLAKLNRLGLPNDLGDIGMRVSSFSIPKFGRASCVALLALGAGAIFADSASAWEPKVPEYSIKVVEGETTFPQRSIVSTSGSVNLPHSQKAHVNLRLVHGGLTVAEDAGSEGASFSQVPQVGDVVYLESPAGNIVGSEVYDGLPSMDATVCAGSTNFSGQRSVNDPVRGGYYSLVLESDPYGNTNLTRLHEGQAQVTSLSGSAYGGNFLTPLALGETVWSEESLETTLSNGAVFTYSSETVRPVGACPLPPAPPPPPPPPPALQGSVLGLSHITIAKLLRSGWVDQVTINQPGTVIQDLYLQGGSVPASASSAKSRRNRHKHKPALLLARGSVITKSAGTVTVSLKLTAQGRRRLKHARSAKVVLVTTLHASSGAKLNLGFRTVTLHR